jgi:hypothetical protein
MWIAEKQHGAFCFKAPVGIMDDAFTRTQANFIEVFPAIKARDLAIVFYLEYIKAFQLKFIIERRNRAHLFAFHETKLRNSKPLCSKLIISEP